MNGSMNQAARWRFCFSPTEALSRCFESPHLEELHMYQNRYDRRMYRRMNRPQNPLRALAGGIFILFLFLAFLVSKGGFFLPLFFAGLALAIVIASVSAFHAWGIYGGLIGGSWLLGLALCVLLGFWPWILLPIALSLFLG